MISKSRSEMPAGPYVWIWLPGRITPVIAGQLVPHADGSVGFLYGRSYREARRSIPIYEPELPLVAGEQVPRGNLKMASCIRDASPDAWGRRVIINRITGKKGDDAGSVELDELTYLRESGSDRIGALDFQNSPDAYVPRESTNAPLEELLEAASRVEKGVALTPALELALNHGTSIGGARPKALVVDGGKKLIAKFSAQNDIYSVVKGEFLLMRLAWHVGLDVAPVRLARSAGKDVLLVERFDRVVANEEWSRRPMVSALTLLGLDEMEARHASYEELAEIIRKRFDHPAETLRELFSRIVFNVLCGNTDDHARNHAAFWDGAMLGLTPAYDLCPQVRTGGEASQAMAIAGADRRSRVATLLAAAGTYGLSWGAACGVVEEQLLTLRAHWREVVDEAELSDVDRRLLAGRAILNPYGFEDLEGSNASLGTLADEILAEMKT